MAYYKTTNNHTKRFTKKHYALVIEAIRHEYLNNPLPHTESFSTLLGVASQTIDDYRPQGIPINLNIPEHSTLKEIPLDLVDQVISWLELVDKAVYDRSARDYEPHTPLGRIPISTRKEPNRFYLIIPDSFNNWYNGYAVRRDTALNDLSALNLEKIFNLVMDINDQLQMKPTEEVVIGIDSLNIDKFPLMSSHIIGDSKIMTSFRQDALDYMEHEFLISYSKIVPELDKIAIKLNIEEFTAFKKELALVFKARASPSKEDAELKNEVSYTVTFNEMTGEILINDKVFKKTNLDSLADSVFTFLHKNPNRKITIGELKKATGKPIKDLPKVIENAGFTGNRLRAFFRVGKDAIYFRPQVTKADLEKLNISSLD